MVPDSSVAHSSGHGIFTTFLAPLALGWLHSFIISFLIIRAWKGLKDRSLVLHFLTMDALWHSVLELLLLCLSHSDGLVWSCELKQPPPFSGCFLSGYFNGAVGKEMKTFWLCPLQPLCPWDRGFMGRYSEDFYTELRQGIWAQDSWRLASCVRSKYNRGKWTCPVGHFQGS